MVYVVVVHVCGYVDIYHVKNTFTIQFVLLLLCIYYIYTYIYSKDLIIKINSFYLCMQIVKMRRVLLYSVCPVVS